MFKRKKKSKVVEFALAFIMGAIVMAIFCIVIDGDAMFSVYLIGKSGDAEGVKDIVNECQLEDTDEDMLKCAVAYIKKDYKYTESHIGVQDVDYTLKNGGVCKDHSLLWGEIAEQYGMDYEYIFTDIVDGYKHMFVVISYPTGYCVADGEVLECFKVEKP